MYSYGPPIYGRAKAGWPARTYLQQAYEDTGCSPEDLPEEMNDREKWRERVRDISVPVARHVDDDDDIVYKFFETYHFMRRCYYPDWNSWTIFYLVSRRDQISCCILLATLHIDKKKWEFFQVLSCQYYCLFGL